MLIPRYWSRADSQATTPAGRRVHFHVWRGSRSDPAEAESLAREAVGRIASRIERGEGFPERYAYGDRPLREEVVREFPGGTDDAPDAALTRNSYGALVLNAARLFFIDVDVPRPRPAAAPSPVWALLDRLLGRPAAEALPGALRPVLEGILGPATATAPADPAGAALERLRRWIAGHPDWRVRVYRTHSGLRYAVTHAPFGPTDAEALAAMSSLGADPQYVRLCRAQKSFRARLTPKPWRVGMENPPVRFPYEGGDEGTMREWEARYARASQGFATCALLEELGSGAEHPDAGPLLRLHDEHARVGSGLPLA
jgi:hypothetical protein